MVATDWSEFKVLRPADFKSLMASPNVLDGRRTYDVNSFRKEGVTITSIGVGPTEEPAGPMIVQSRG